MSKQLIQQKQPQKYPVVVQDMSSRAKSTIKRFRMSIKKTLLEQKHARYIY